MSDGIQQTQHINNLEELNTLRKQSQDQMVKQAEQQINHNENILIASADLHQFHEGVIGIVAGKLTEKYHKPSLILSINTQTGYAVGSLR